ncbi:MAG: EI24 domain-containing protein [Pseudomonadota bacterium]
MDILTGLQYNIRGLWFGVKSGKLLFWGLVRLVVVLLITIVLGSLIFVYHQGIMDLMWAKPESPWIVWLWHLLSWLVSLFLLGLAAVLSYLISQIVFSVIIMDHMSRITELKVTGSVKEPEKISVWKQFAFLMRQEIPRGIVPVLLSILLMILGWFVLLGPVMVLLSSGIAIIFLAWDNTDLVPARRLVPFKNRFRFLLKTILFHLGFGLPFLIPGLNILFLSFSPVGATLYFLEKQDAS